MSLQSMTTFSRALQRLRAAAHLGMGDEWFEMNAIGDKSYQDIVELLKVSEGGKAVIHEFAEAFVRGMNKAADEEDYRKFRLPDGSTTDRATLVRQAKEAGDLTTGWGQHFLKIDPVDSKWFEQFHLKLTGVAEAYAATLTWAQGIGPGMLLLGGIPGTGKTHLAKSAWNYLIHGAWHAPLVDESTVPRDVFYRREIDLIKDLQRAISDKNVEAVMVEVQTCPWLIIDDYGAAASGPWGRGQLDAIIDARWESAGNLRTMLTTNLDTDGMRAQSPRIWSRLSDRTRAKRVAMKAHLEHCPKLTNPKASDCNCDAAEDYREKRGS